jgi:hypothetical protein
VLTAVIATGYVPTDGEASGGEEEEVRAACLCQSVCLLLTDPDQTQESSEEESVDDSDADASDFDEEDEEEEGKDWDVRRTCLVFLGRCSHRMLPHVARCRSSRKKPSAPTRRHTKTATTSASGRAVAVAARASRRLPRRASTDSCDCFYDTAAAQRQYARPACACVWLRAFLCRRTTYNLKIQGAAYQEPRPPAAFNLGTRA